ncbi:MAG: glycerophosphodiester phosphodiesterase [Rhizobiales bacterium 32-66-8]|nr:MAG: glycerophosphodiester phosphodiesterase [Rhizobiales bacterium 32-66-8]
MPKRFWYCTATLGALLTLALPLSGTAHAQAGASASPPSPAQAAQLGPRPFFLVDDLPAGDLKSALKACEAGPFVARDFSIGHRGAPLQFPEHTRAGILECDVTFTKDRQLVCRHDQCDLHTSTDILAKPALAAKCTKPFTPADAAAGRKAEALCCTSDLTLAEFKTLRGKMDGANTAATTVQDYMNGTAKWRTDLYATDGTLMTHQESIALFQELGVKFTPELKAPRVAMPFEGTYTQDAYAQQMIDDYKAAGIAPDRVFPQSFQLRDVLYWLKAEPAFGAQGVFLDDRDETVKGFDAMKPETWSPGMAELAAAGVKIIAPPLHVLVTLDGDKKIVPSAYATAAKAAGLKIITWSLERSGTLTDGGGYYYQSVKDAIRTPGDTYNVLDVLAKDVGVIGVFSDWPATVTYYANCMGLK